MIARLTECMALGNTPVGDAEEKCDPNLKAYQFQSIIRPLGAHNIM